MIIKTAEELRHYLPSHVFSNLDTMSGFLDNSENDFLAERIGKPLLASLRKNYASIMGKDESWSSKINDPDVEFTVWETLIVLCQRCVVFDAFCRAADIHAISVNQAGLNIADSNGYENANDKAIDKYKAQLTREAHAASNRLLIQLEDWQKELGDFDEESDLSEDPRKEIVSLWRKSAYYYFADGLLFNTATEFNLFVNIYDSREKFIQILPDIRYCQETFIEAEIGTELLIDLIDKHRKNKLSAVEANIYQKMQRVLSLKVEGRSKLLYRKEANDEASGHIRLMLDYMRKHQKELNEEAVRLSPIFDPSVWKVASEDETHKENTANPNDKKPETKAKTTMFGFPCPQRGYGCEGDGMLITPMI